MFFMLSALQSTSRTLCSPAERSTANSSALQSTKTRALQPIRAISGQVLSLLCSQVKPNALHSAKPSACLLKPSAANQASALQPGQAIFSPAKPSQALSSQPSQVLTSAVCQQCPKGSVYSSPGLIWNDMQTESGYWGSLDFGVYAPAAVAGVWLWLLRPLCAAGTLCQPQVYCFSSAALTCAANRGGTLGDDV